VCSTPTSITYNAMDDVREYVMASLPPEKRAVLVKWKLDTRLDLLIEFFEKVVQIDYYRDSHADILKGRDLSTSWRLYIRSDINTHLHIYTRDHFRRLLDELIKPGPNTIRVKIPRKRFSLDMTIWSEGVLVDTIRIIEFLTNRYLKYEC